MNNIEVGGRCKWYANTKPIVKEVKKRMPHDKHGKLLKNGDTVLIRATVKDVQTHNEFCNLSVETEELMHPGNYKSTITLNAKQVELVERTVVEEVEATLEPVTDPEAVLPSKP